MGVIVVMLACKHEKSDSDGMCFSIVVHNPRVDHSHKGNTFRLSFLLCCFQQGHFINSLDSCVSEYLAYILHRKQMSTF